MSHYVDFLCVDCSEVADFDANRQHRSFWAILKYRAQLEHLNDELFKDGAAYYFTDDVGHLGKVARFFSAHVGHQIVVKGEYGAIYTGCNGAPDYNTRTQAQKEAWRLRDCKLPEGHEGEHQPGLHADYRNERWELT
jgi:hypothetical protein